MLNIGMTELLVFGIVALLILGPEKLPEGVRFAGKFYGKMKRLISNVHNDLDRELRLAELREHMHTEMQRIQALEAKMQAQMQALKMPLAPIQPPNLPTTQRCYTLVKQKSSSVYTSLSLPVHRPNKALTTLKVAV